MKKQQQPLIIGIGGVSRSGKTELASFLCKEFINLDYRTIVIHQDHYPALENTIPKIKDRIDWEVPASIDTTKYQSAIASAQQKGFDVIIAEGFLNFHDSTLLQLFEKKIFVEINRSTFEKRRTVDKRWGSEPDWYIEHIWNSYGKYGKTILTSDADYISISGENRQHYKTAWEYVKP